MTTVELRAKTPEELKVELESLLKAHFSLRMQVALQQFTKNSELKKVRRSIARVRTILREKA